jgi:hypothetical protein
MPQTEPTAVAEAPRPSRKKTVIMIACILLVEAVVFVGAMWKFLGGHPAEAEAADAAHTQQATEDDKIVEALVLEAKMPNNKSGVTYLYPTEVYVQVKKRHAEHVKGEIEQFQNEIKAEILAIWRTAEPQHFQEPRLENLTRKVYAMLNDRFGMDKEREEPIIAKVVIVMSTGFRIDT